MEYVYSVSIVCGLMKTKIFSQEIFNKERIPAGSRKENYALSPSPPRGCHVTSINNGFPDLIRSNRERRFTAPALVRGGKNSSEKNLSLESILALIFSASVASKELNMSGDVGLEVTGVVTGDSAGVVE